MREAVALGIASVIGACAPDGIFIEAVPPAGTDTVQVDLYIAKPCDVCPGFIQPEGFEFSAIGAETFTHDGVDYRALVEDGSAWFELRGTGTPKLVVAVGTNANGDVTSVAVMRNTIDLDAGSKHYLAPLDPVEALAENTPRNSEVAAIHRWPSNRERPRADCLAVDAITPEARTYLVVPSTGDFDCDGLLAQDGECAPFAFRGERIDQSRHCAVLSEHKFPGDPAPCVIGHAVECEDFPDGQDLRTCAENFHFGGEAVCVPQAVCTSDLGTLNTPDKHIAVMQGLGAPLISCTLFGELDANNALLPCQPDPSIAIGLHRDMNLLTSCSDKPGFVAFDDPNLLADPERLYSEGGAGTELQVGQATIRIEAFENCALRLSWQGTVIDAVEEVPALMKVFFDVGGDRRAMLMPVKFSFQSGCAQPAGFCILDGAAPDPMYRCGE